RVAGNSMFWNGDTTHPAMALAGNVWLFEGGLVQAPISGPSTGGPGTFITAGLYFQFSGAGPTTNLVANPGNVGAGAPTWVDLASGDVRLAAPYLTASGVVGGASPTATP